MKTATIPSLRVDPELRTAAEDVLEEGESLSSFVEQSIRDGVQRRQAQREFIARGLKIQERSPADTGLRVGGQGAGAPAGHAEEVQADCRREMTFRVRFTRGAGRPRSTV